MATFVEERVVMKMVRRHMRVGFAVWCLVAMIFGQALFLASHADATGEAGRPPLPYGIVRLPFDGRYEITQVPGCGWHNRNNINYETGYNTDRRSQEMNDRSFDFGLFDGTQVLAAGGGTVLDAYQELSGAKVLVIGHGSGQRSDGVQTDDVRSYYVHLSEFLVAIGDPVSAGQVIGLSGHSGGVPPHLHFAVTTNGDPATTGVAANVNDLPGIEWNTEQLNEAGYAICNSNARDYAVGGADVQTAVEPAPSDATDDEWLTTAVTYDRSIAVDVAFGTLHEQYQYDNDSANYVSKVLWAGGLPQTDEWVQTAAAHPNDLVNYLITPHRINEDVSYQPATRFQVAWSDNTAQGAMPGDVIAYDWEGDGIVDHVAVVTNLNNDGFPEVSEHSPTQENRYWSYSIAQDNWIESAYPGSVAYLIQIAPITLPNF